MCHHKSLHHQSPPQEEPRLEHNSESERLGLVEAVDCTEPVGGATVTRLWPETHEDRTVVDKVLPLREPGPSLGEPQLSLSEPGLPLSEPRPSLGEPGVSLSEPRPSLGEPGAEVAMSRSLPPVVDGSAAQAEVLDQAEERRGGTGERRGGTEERRGGTEERRGGTGERRGGTGERRGGTGERRGGTGETNVTSNAAGSTPVRPEDSQDSEPQSLALLPLNIASLPLLRSLAGGFTPDMSQEKEPPNEPPSGDLTAPAGDLTAPSGDLTAPAGDLTAPSGDLTAPAGDLTAPAGDLTAPAGDLTAPARQPQEPEDQPAAVLPSLPGCARENTTDVEGVEPAEPSAKGVASAVTMATKATTEGEEDKGAVFPYPPPEPVSTPPAH